MPRGINIYFIGLTTRKANNEDESKSLSGIYLKMHKARKKTGHLKNNKLPKLSEILDERDIKMAEALVRKEEWLKDRKGIYLLESFSRH